VSVAIELFVRLALVAALVSLVASQDSVRGEEPPRIIRIEATNIGDYGAKAFWQLHIDRDGAGRVTARGKEREFKVSEASMERLSRMIATSKFMELPDRFGVNIIDGPVRTLTIKTTQESKTVKVFFVREPEPQIEEVLQLMIEVRGLFEHPDAVDFRPWDQERIERFRAAAARDEE
jgi:hypothetical protein